MLITPRSRDTPCIMTGEELRRIRARLGLTQAELADRLGTTRNTVARWERDEVRMRETAARLIQMIARAEKGSRR